MALSLSPVRTDKDTEYPKHIKKAAVGLAIIEKYKDEFVEEFDATEEDVEKWLEHCLQTYEEFKQELDAKADAVMGGKSINSNRNGPSIPVIDKMIATLDIFTHYLEGSLDLKGRDSNGKEVLTGPVLKKAVGSSLDEDFPGATLSPSWYTYQIEPTESQRKKGIKSKSAKWIATGDNLTTSNGKQSVTKTIDVPLTLVAMRQWKEQASVEQQSRFQKEVEGFISDVESAWESFNSIDDGK